MQLFKIEQGGFYLPISILRRVLAHTVTLNIDVCEDNVLRILDKRVPLRAVSELEVLDSPSLEADDTKQNRAQDVNVHSKEIIPHLTVAVESAATIDVDIVTTELEERGRVLESLLEGVILPVVRIVGELDRALDVLY